MALTDYIGQLVEHFRWRGGEASDDLQSDTRNEAHRKLADVRNDLLLLAGRLDIDLIKAVNNQIQENAAKYSLNRRARGRSDKYSDL